MNEEEYRGLHDKLRHELGNSLMTVLTFTHLIDREAAGNPRIRSAVVQIRDAVFRSRASVEEVCAELARTAGLLSSSRRGQGGRNVPE